MIITRRTERMTHDLHLQFTSLGRKVGVFHMPGANTEDDDFHVLFSQLPIRINAARLLQEISSVCTIVKLQLRIGEKDRYYSTALLRVRHNYEVNHVTASFDNTALLSSKIITCRALKPCRTLEVIAYIQKNTKQKVCAVFKPFMVGRWVLNITHRTPTWGHIEIEFEQYDHANLVYEQLNNPKLRLFQKDVIPKFLVSSPEYM